MECEGWNKVTGPKQQHACLGTPYVGMRGGQAMGVSFIGGTGRTVSLFPVLCFNFYFNIVDLIKPLF